VQVAKRLAQGQVYYGWYLVGVGFVIQFLAAGLANSSIGPFLKPMVEELGWSRTSYAFVQTIANLVIALGMPFIGGPVDRIGARPLVVIGAIFAGGGTIYLSQVQDLWLFYLLRGFIIPVGLVCTSRMVVNVAMANWFRKKRGRAIGIASMGVPMASTIVPPVSAFLMGTVGWRAGWVVLGLTVWIAMIPSAWLLLVRRPEDLGLLLDGSPSDVEHNKEAEKKASRVVDYPWTRQEALMTATFWLMAFGGGITHAAQQGTGLHFMPFFWDQGYSPEQAAFLTAMGGMPVLLCRPFWAFFCERGQIRHWAFLAYLGGALSIAMLLAAKSLLHLYLAQLTFAFFRAGFIPAAEIMWADYFGRYSLGKVRGIASPVSWTGAALGPLLGAYIFDLTGQYFWAFSLYSIFYVVGAFCFLIARPPNPPSRGDLQPVRGQASRTMKGTGHINLPFSTKVRTESGPKLYKILMEFSRSNQFDPTKWEI
jgi:MFS family permease